MGLKTGDTHGQFNRENGTLCLGKPYDPICINIYVYMMYVYMIPCAGNVDLDHGRCSK